jgi:alanine dehydrogenase
MSDYFKIGVIGKINKIGEKRVAIHPEHLNQIPASVKKKLFFENNYGKNFGISNKQLAINSSGKTMSRDRIFNYCNCFLIPKITPKDLKNVGCKSVVCGWPHLTQQKKTTQIAIDKKLTIIDWSYMNRYDGFNKKYKSIFYKVGEIAGRAGVLHVLSIFGILGRYGFSNKKVAVISYGNVSRGALEELQNQGFKNITVYVNRKLSIKEIKEIGFKCKQLFTDKLGKVFVVDVSLGKIPFADEVHDFDIIINGIHQDTNLPRMFISKKEESKLKKNTIIVDISCDKGMGFWCAKPTTFKKPIINSRGKFYYSVDNTPSLFWNSTTWEISKAFLPFLEDIIGGSDAWIKNKVLANAIRIYNGFITDKKIIEFQNRENQYPYKVITNK